MLELLIKAGVDRDKLHPKTFHFYVNDREVTREWHPCRILINGSEANLESLAEYGDYVDFSFQAAPTLRQVLAVEEEQTTVELIVNNEPVVLHRGGIMLQMNGKNAVLDDTLEDGAVLKVMPQVLPPIVSDLLTQITVTPKSSGNLVIRLTEWSRFHNPGKFRRPGNLYWEEFE